MDKIFDLIPTIESFNSFFETIVNAQSAISVFSIIVGTIALCFAVWLGRICFASTKQCLENGPEFQVFVAFATGFGSFVASVIAAVHLIDVSVWYGIVNPAGVVAYKVFANML